MKQSLVTEQMCPRRRLFDLQRRVVVFAGYFLATLWLLLMAAATVNCDSVVNKGAEMGEMSVTSSRIMEVLPSALNGEAIQLAIAWNGQGADDRKVDISVRTKKTKLGCPGITCLKLGIDAVSE